MQSVPEREASSSIPIDLVYREPVPPTTITEDSGGLEAEDQGKTASREPDENTVNADRLADYMARLSPQLLALIARCDLEYGFTTELDIFLRKRLAENRLAAKAWINALFVKHIEDVVVACAILRTVAHFDYSEVFPEGPTMALAALHNKDIMVRECAIRAFENWRSAECLPLLRATQFAEPWMTDYVAKVIADLEEASEAKHRRKADANLRENN